MKVYFVRHGESLGNKKHAHQGSGERLSKEGKKQALKVAKRLKEIDLDVVYSSPYVRTKETSEIIAKELKLKIEYWDELRERKKPSEIEGLSYHDPYARKIDELMRKNRLIPDWSHSDSESFNDLLLRAKKVEKHLLKYHRNQNVLCVSHLSIMKFIVFHLIFQDKVTPEIFWQFYYHSYGDNTGITYLLHSKKFGWELKTWNDLSHL